MGLGKWIKRKMAAIAFATASVEKAALGQGEGSDLGSGSKQHRRLNQGSLADDLKQGQETQQVQELRWRMYKVLEESKKYKTQVTGYDDEGFMITETVLVEGLDTAQGTLAKAVVDEHDDYPVELIVMNDEITRGKMESMFGLDEIPDSQVTSTVDGDGDVTKTLGEISGESDESINKSERVISCTRELRAKFEIEKFAKKMNVRTISETEKLLEFYVSVYPDEFKSY